MLHLAIVSRHAGHALRSSSLAALLATALALTVAACGSDDAAAGDDIDAASAADANSSADGVASDGEVGDAAQGDAAQGDSDVDRKPQPQPPKPFAYTGKTCPTFQAGPNKLFSWAGTRTFDLYLPSETKGAPLLFLWHGLGDTKENFGLAMGAASLSKKLGAIVVVPQAAGKVTGWGWATSKDWTEDGALFDDLLACVEEQYDIDNSRVWSMGFSSGGLWTTWLVLNRSSFLAAAVVWSGGSSASINVYKSPKRKLPVLVAWGGPEDQALYKFEPMSIAFANGLQGDGHFVLRCNHKLGHTIPGGGLAWASVFLGAHSYSTVGHTPLQDDAAALAKFPDYCEIPSQP